MTTQNDFSPEEWRRIVAGPAVAGLIVADASPGHTSRELASMAQAYERAKRAHGDIDLLGEIVSWSPDEASGPFSDEEAIRPDGLAQLGDAVRLLERKARPEEVDAYRRFAITVAERAAEADAEAGFFGRSGEGIDDAERAALEEISRALGLEPSP